MTVQSFKAAINNAKFPFLYARAGRGILQAGLDVAPRVGSAFSGPTSVDYNTIQMLYCENVLPTAEGIMSVSLTNELPAYSPPTTDFDQMITLRDDVEHNFLFSPGRGKNYVFNETTGIWVAHNSFVWADDKIIISRAYVAGRTFIFYERDRIIEWDVAGSVFNTLALTLPPGYAITDIRGCFGASNYLILFTDTEILWSSLTNILDFNDSVGGAGKQIPLDLKGQITCGVPISGGFILYTSRNAVAAFFTNSAATPFSYREVQGSGGVATYEQITGDANQAEHFTYGSSGLQVVSLQRAETIHPDCTDFLSSKQYETWNTTTGQVEYSALAALLSVKLQYLANRYLVISYGMVAEQYTYALFYDTALQRWGKVKVTHVDVGLLPLASIGSSYRYFEMPLAINSFEYSAFSYADLQQTYGTVAPIRVGFAFLQNTGAVQLMISDPLAQAPGGVALFGHVQVARDALVCFQRAVLDGLDIAPSPRLRILGSAPTDGYNRTLIYDAFLEDSSERRVSYLSGEMPTMENFDVVVEGHLVLSSLLLRTTVHGQG